MRADYVVQRLALGCLLAVLAACGSGEQGGAAASAPVSGAAAPGTAKPSSADEPFASAGQSAPELWAHSCALCHVDGNAGAPRIGSVEDWQPRLAKGADVLLKHTLEGFNQMPPLGYCMACKREDFVAMIDLMTEGVSAQSLEPAP